MSNKWLNDQKQLTNINYVLVTVAESAACDYWADIRNIVRDEEHNVVSLEIREDDNGNVNPKPGHWKEINASALLKARRKVLDGEVKVASQIAAQFVGSPEDWNHDAGGADVLAQVALMGDIKYG